MREESTCKAEEETRRLALSPTLYLDDTTKAGDRLGYDAGLVRYQILAYADRNTLVLFITMAQVGRIGGRALFLH